MQTVVIVPAGGCAPSMCDDEGKCRGQYPLARFRRLQRSQENFHQSAILTQEAPYNIEGLKLASSLNPPQHIATIVLQINSRNRVKRSPGGWTPGFSRLKVPRIRVGEGPRESLALSRTSPDARLFHRAAVPHEVSHDVHDDRHDRGARGSRDRTRARNPPRSLRQI